MHHVADASVDASRNEGAADGIRSRYSLGVPRSNLNLKHTPNARFSEISMNSSITSLYRRICGDQADLAICIGFYLAQSFRRT